MQMSEEKVFVVVRTILLESYPAFNISMDTFLDYGETNCLFMSSIEIVEFIVKLEKAFDIVIDFNERYYTVRDVVHSVVSYLNEKDEVVLEDVSNES